MTMIIEKPMTGVMTFIIASNCSFVTMLAKTVEKDMPINMKFKTGVGRRLLVKRPIPAEIRSMHSITAKVLAGFLVCCSIFPVIKPVIMPIITGKNTKSRTTGMETPVVEIWAETKASTRKKTKAPTRSSRAAIGIRVFVTGPSVLNSLTTDRDGAGAVARAIAPNKKAR